ncbi:hypothetical protein SETIT_4G021200v2 [Setaria italica]|uniref:Uncharacterized protein n=1 Tax=Setaria italica TaxID=4555 RepID=K3Y013_SETIT|nr:hypothetical protein SETIT_4G021200v2 [Setaria italica]
MASSKSIASPALVFLAMMALMLAACAQALAPAPAPAPAPSSQGSCPPGFKSYLDMTDFMRGAGRVAVTFVNPNLMPVVQSILTLIPHTGLKLCVCFESCHLPPHPMCVILSMEQQAYVCAAY